MQREVVYTEQAPQPVGPYSQAIMAEGRYVFVSGQVAIDPNTGKLIDGDVQAQTRLVFENLKAVLAAAGSSLDQVVKMTVMLNDIGDFATLNEIYASYFGENPPARATFGVQLPVGALVEIECVALVNG